jgi:hypothetical protein
VQINKTGRGIQTETVAEREGEEQGEGRMKQKLEKVQARGDDVMMWSSGRGTQAVRDGKVQVPGRLHHQGLCPQR